MGHIAKIVDHVQSVVKARLQSWHLRGAHCKLLRQAIDQGDLGAAVAIENALSVVVRQHPEVLVLRGRLAWARGDEVGASGYFHAAISTPPPRADAHFSLAALCMHQGMESVAVEHALAAERLEPGGAEMRSLIGVVRHHQGDIPAAQAAFKAALEADSKNVNAHRGLATIHFQNRDWLKAEDHYRCLLELLPDAPDVLSGCASCRVAIGREEEAWPLFARAVNLPESTADVHRDYAVALFNEGRLAEARVQFDIGLHQDASQPILHVARANCDLIANGNSASAWAEYEWRRELYPAHFGKRTKLWDGSPSTERRLLIYAEQGIGDVIMFARCIAHMNHFFQEIVLQVPPTLGRLMRASASRFDWNITDWVENRSRVEPSEVAYDLEVPLLSLMHLCGFAVERATKPYLDVDENLVRYWAQKLGKRGADRLRVGLVWAGNPVRVEDNLRSILPEQLAPLQTIRNVEFVSLQMDARPQYKNSLLPIPVIDLTPEISDFADTAAIMRNLDLVLSIDTAAAHLAGALGIPCWVLLSKIPDWRWEMGGMEQPWYSTHRSFRVGRQRDWLELMDRVASQLRQESRQSLAKYRTDGYGRV